LNEQKVYKITPLACEKEGNHFFVDRTQLQLQKEGAIKKIAVLYGLKGANVLVLSISLTDFDRPIAVSVIYRGSRMGENLLRMY
jgi:hypothetical protein